jgi:hypothetical protein
MKVHEYTRIENKLELKSRNAGDRLSWFEHEGVVVVRTKRSHGNKDLPQHLIRQQLKLNESQFSDLITCSLRKEDYIAILIAKGLIVPKKVPMSQQKYYGVECKNPICHNGVILGEYMAKPKTKGDAITFIKMKAGKLTCSKCGETRDYDQDDLREF